MGDGRALATLEVSRVSLAFAGVVAVDDVSMSVRQGEVLGLIGGNGAGKTTLVNILTGFQRPDSGSVVLDGTDVTKWPTHRLSRHGVTRTFQGVRPFGQLTVAENLEVAARATGETWRAARVTAARLLEQVGILEHAGSRADALSYGSLRKLSMARALAGRPRFLLLDEPAAGLDEDETHEMGTALLTLKDEHGCGVILIEHDVPLVMRVCDTVQVMVRGRSLAVGTPDEIRSHPEVRSQYFGHDSEEARHA